MAVTGLGLVGFVVSHMAANLRVLFGRDAMNQSSKPPSAVGWVAVGGTAVSHLHWPWRN